MGPERQWFFVSVAEDLLRFTSAIYTVGTESFVVLNAKTSIEQPLEMKQERASCAGITLPLLSVASRSFVHQHAWASPQEQE